MGWPERDIAQAAGFIAPPGYSRHRPESTLLYRLVAEHYPRFRDRRGQGPRDHRGRDAFSIALHAV
jgi:hypothetical protein